MRLIYCAGGNRAYVQAAASCGWHTGLRSDDTLYPEHLPLALIDVSWKEYDWEMHFMVVRRNRPIAAVIPDILAPEGIVLALHQATLLAPFVSDLILVPKVDCIDQLPRSITAARVVLGYSVPTKYGGTTIPVWRFQGWPVHLLGGSPRAQHAVASMLDVVSADGNMAQKLAHKGITYGADGRTVSPMGADRRPGMPLRTLTMSLTNIRAMWEDAGYALEARA